MSPGAPSAHSAAMPNVHLADATIRSVVSANSVPARKSLVYSALALYTCRFRPPTVTLLVYSHSASACLLSSGTAGGCDLRMLCTLVLASSPFVPSPATLSTMFFSRRRREPDRYLRWKAAALLVGIGVALIGFELESRWVVNLAIAVVLVGFSLRFLDRGAR